MIQQFYFWVFIPPRLKTGSLSDICKSMVIVALFTKAKRWKQPKCPSTDEWLTKYGRYIQCNIIHT